jgi:predicted RNase H-like HicB family nuclease
MKVIIYWSEQDQAFIAEVPELAGCAAERENLSASSGQSRSHYP